MNTLPEGTNEEDDRKESAESSLSPDEQGKAPKPKGDAGCSKPVSTKLFPHPEKFELKQTGDTVKGVTHATLPVSKKPIQCPQKDCSKFVGVFDLTTHYKYEHREVPHINASFDGRNTFEFSPMKIKNGVVLGMAVLNIKELLRHEVATPSVSSKMSGTAFEKVQGTFVVLATKLSESDLEERHRDAQKSEGLIDTDKWIFWLGSNIKTNLYYTLVVSTLDGKTRQKYFGPIMHVEEGASHLLQSGKCLVLNGHLIVSMTENFSKNLNLDVVVYAEED